MQVLGLGPVHLIEIHAVKLGLRGLQAQLMLTLFCLREVQRTGLKHAAGLACFLFQRVIEVHRIVLDTADIGAVVQPVNIGRRVPSGARCQFVTLQQYDIRPSQFCQMVQDGTADHAASDDNGLGMGAHLGNLSFDDIFTVCNGAVKR